MHVELPSPDGTPGRHFPFVVSPGPRSGVRDSASRVAGHSEAMSDHYFQLTNPEAERAILTLKHTGSDTKSDTKRDLSVAAGGA